MYLQPLPFDQNIQANQVFQVIPVRKDNYKNLSIDTSIGCETVTYHNNYKFAELHRKNVPHKMDLIM